MIAAELSVGAVPAVTVLAAAFAVAWWPQLQHHARTISRRRREHRQHRGDLRRVRQAQQRNTTR